MYCVMCMSEIQLLGWFIELVCLFFQWFDTVGWAQDGSLLCKKIFRNPQKFFGRCSLSQSYLQKNRPFRQKPKVVYVLLLIICRRAAVVHWLRWLNLAQQIVFSALTLLAGQQEGHSSCKKVPRAGSGVVRMDPLRFLAGCRTRRLNQV